MTSILVSSDVESLGNGISKRVSEALGYDYVGAALLTDIAKKHGISARDVARAVGQDARLPRKPGKHSQAILVYLQAAVSRRLLLDNTVIDGLGAHLHVRGVAHVLNVRVLSDIRSKTHRLAAEKRVSPTAARKILERQERQIREWSLFAFGMDETSPSSYDMVISLGNIDTERAVATIADTAKDRKFQPMTYSRKCLENLALASEVRAALVSLYPKVKVTAHDGTVRLVLSKKWFGWQSTVEALRDIAGKVEGVDGIEIHTSMPPGDAPWADAKSA